MKTWGDHDKRAHLKHHQRRQAFTPLYFSSALFSERQPFNKGQEASKAAQRRGHFRPLVSPPQEMQKGRECKSKLPEKHLLL